MFSRRFVNARSSWAVLVRIGGRLLLIVILKVLLGIERFLIVVVIIFFRFDYFGCGLVVLVFSCERLSRLSIRCDSCVVFFFMVLVSLCRFCLVMLGDLSVLVVVRIVVSGECRLCEMVRSSVVLIMSLWCSVVVLMIFDWSVL